MSTAATLKLRVARKTEEAIGISSFELVSPDGSALPAFTAGAHLDVHLDFATKGLTRQYSLCNKPGETHRYVIAVLRDANSRGGSEAMHDKLQEGQLLEVSLPRNHFPLVAAKHSLLLAGGIGITPILAMAEQLSSDKAGFTLHYCTRSEERTAFVARIKASGFASNCHHHYDDGAAAQMLDFSLLLEEPQADTHLYVCGPRGFMDAVLNTARAQGWPEAQLHYEFFGAAVVKSDADAGFDVKIASTGQIIPIANNISVAQALNDAGVEVLTSCEQGVCGTCLTRVLEGEPDHRDSYLTPEEQAANDQFTPCCSRSKSKLLVLDL